MSLRRASKIVTLDSLRDSRGILLHGTFDLFHIGHLHYIKQGWALKARNEPLIVTLTGDKYVQKGPKRPVFCQEHRAEMIAAVEYVHYVAIVFERTAQMAIKTIKPRVYCKGSETRLENNPDFDAECAAVKAYGGKMQFLEKILEYSSGKLLSGEYMR